MKRDEAGPLTFATYGLYLKSRIGVFPVDMGGSGVFWSPFCFFALWKHFLFYQFGPDGDLPRRINGTIRRTGTDCLPGLFHHAGAVLLGQGSQKQQRRN